MQYTCRHTILGLVQKTPCTGVYSTIQTVQKRGLFGRHQGSIPAGTQFRD